MEEVHDVKLYDLCKMPLITGSDMSHFEKRNSVALYY